MTGLLRSAILTLAMLICSSACASDVLVQPESKDRADTRQETKVDVQRARDLAVHMRDGTKLLVDLWRPSDEDGPLPVILVRTPYGRKYEQSLGHGWASQGYAVVIQAVRGRDGSEGTWVPWENELVDGYDTIDWIVRQPWCNGRVGMAGGSYLGHTQILAAASGHPNLVCIVPISPGSDGFSDVPFSGGILKLGLMSWLYACRDPLLDLSGRYPASANDRNFRHLPLTKIDQAYVGMDSAIWQHWVRVETMKDMPGLTIWDHAAKAKHRPAILHIDGVWDHESMATRRNWAQFNALGYPNQYLLFGPWAHDPNKSRRYADLDYGADAVVNMNGMIRAWYAHWLKDGPEVTFPQVQVFATGANRWLHFDQWPAADAKPRTWHVGGKGGGELGLSQVAPSELVSWRWTYDPSRLHGRDVTLSSTTRLWFKAGDRDALVLATSKFEEETLLTGPVELEISLESSAEDTDVFALLVEISPRGEVRTLQHPSPLRMRFREGYDRAVPLTPGKVATAKWALGDFAHVFAKGSRLGLAIRSDWFPICARNLGTLESMATATKMITQNNQIHSGPEHRSVIRMYELSVDKLVNE